MFRSFDDGREFWPKRRIALTFETLEPFFCLGDAFLIVSTGFVGAAGYQLLANDSGGDLGAYLGLGLVSSVGYALVAWHMGLYRTSSLLTERWDGWSVLASWALVALFLTLVLFFLKIGNQVSRGSIIGFVGLAGTALLIGRKFAKLQLSRALAVGSLKGRRVVLLGVNDELAAISANELLLRFGLSEIERIALPAMETGDTQWLAPASVLDVVMAKARSDEVAEMILAMPWRQAALLDQVRQYFRVSPLPVRLLPDAAVRAMWDRQAGSIGPPPIIDLQRLPLTALERCVKRTFDIVVAGLAFVLLMPAMALVALAIKLDSSGPVIFRQHRRGFNGREFIIFKFRTMSVLENGPAVRQAERYDPRVTRIGRILRKASIDEIPQLLNVISGEMSIVGPRPHAVAHDDEYGAVIGNYAFRHHMKPGITGWAQVHGLRGETSDLARMKERVEFDVWYISNWSLMLDITIMLRTCFEVASSRNAY